MIQFGAQLGMHPPAEQFALVAAEIVPRLRAR